MRIENEMLSRFKTKEAEKISSSDVLSLELDMFFDNVMDTVVDFFEEREELIIK